ncbi:hypothetical protein LOAG_18359 [Loa loa]|nr:hypothetical protein LOAG_18359 [Loa loa]EJD74309.1 hypothetical protein LOAG_18359 [Loa loa]
MTTKQVHIDQSKEISNDGKITSTLNAQNLIATTTALSPSVEISTRAPLFTDIELKSNYLQQQVPASMNHVSIPSIQTIHQKPQVAHLSQPSNSSQPEQIQQRSVLFTATERILIGETDEEQVSSKGQEMITTLPAKVLVWMPPGITGLISHETSNKFHDINATTSSDNSLNSIVSETLISQANEIPALSLSSLSPSLLPITTTIATATTTTATTNTMPMTEVEAKILSDYQFPIAVPVARPLNPTNIPEAVIRDNKFLDQNPQFVIPESNVMQIGLENSKIHSNPINTMPRSYEPNQFL